MTDEVWKAVPASRLLGIPAGYEASDAGRVRSVPRTLRDGRTAGGVVLAPWRDKDGYWMVQLGRRKVPVHIAVLLAWHGRPEGRHLGGQDDNRPAKLAWGSRRENERDKKETERRREREEVDGTRPWELATPFGTSETGDLRR